MVIAVDFDGTCVTHEYPLVGRDIGAADVLRRLVAIGHKLILWTMRDGKELQDAVEWFGLNRVELWGVGVNPEQHEWTGSRKAYAKLYIDDAAFGCPLIANGKDRPYVDWSAVELKLLPAAG
jgi:hypothetical protein